MGTGKHKMADEICGLAYMIWCDPLVGTQLFLENGRAEVSLSIGMYGFQLLANWMGKNPSFALEDLGAEQTDVTTIQGETSFALKY